MKRPIGLSIGWGIACRYLSQTAIGLQLDSWDYIDCLDLEPTVLGVLCNDPFLACRKSPKQSLFGLVFFFVYALCSSQRTQTAVDDGSIYPFTGESCHTYPIVHAFMACSGRILASFFSCKRNENSCEIGDFVERRILRAAYDTSIARTTGFI